MSKEKISKLEVKSNKEENSKPSENNKRLLSFDVYFQKLVSERRTLPHHKAPMKKFAEQKGLLVASEEDFEKLFKSY